MAPTSVSASRNPEPFPQPPAPMRGLTVLRGAMMDNLMPLLFLVAWVALQTWIFPKLGLGGGS